MPASIIDSPFTRSMKNSPSPTIDAGRGRTSSMASRASVGEPAAIRPTSGMCRIPERDADGPIPGAYEISMARGLVASLRMYPLRCSASRCAWTVEGEARPTASAISRTLGGYPRASTVCRMKSRTFF
jgi:hypothetical protein